MKSEFEEILNLLDEQWTGIYLLSGIMGDAVAAADRNDVGASQCTDARVNIVTKDLFRNIHLWTHLPTRT